MTYTRGLSVNGTDLGTMPGVIINRLDLRAPAIRRGSHDVLSGKQGQAGNQLPLDAYAFSVLITVVGSDEWEVLARLDAVDTLCEGTDGLVDLVRRIPTSPTAYRLDTAHGQYTNGGALALLDLQTGQTELQFTNLDGAWYDSTGPRWRQ